MMNFRLIGAAALSLMPATPAMAMQHSYHHHYGYIHNKSQVLNAPKFGYRSAYGAYNFYPEHDFAPGNADHYDDFARRNTFN
jgi:hypothetical protein